MYLPLFQSIWHETIEVWTAVLSSGLLESSPDKPSDRSLRPDGLQQWSHQFSDDDFILEATLHSVTLYLLPASHQEVPQEAGPAGVAGGRHHRHRVPHRGQVRPQHHHAAHPLLHHAVLVPGTHPHRHLDRLEVLHTVRPGGELGLGGLGRTSWCLKGQSSAFLCLEKTLRR